MNIEREDRESVAVVLQAEEARHLLAALRSHSDALGAAGAELERELSALGVTPAAPAAAREEYMPPS